VSNQTARDLLGRPALAQAVVHIRHEVGIAGLGPPQVRPPAGVRPRLGRLGIVPSLRGGIALALPADGAAMAAQAAGDFGVRMAEKTHAVDDISFVHGKMAVRHREHSLA